MGNEFGRHPGTGRLPKRHKRGLSALGEGSSGLSALGKEGWTVAGMAVDGVWLEIEG